MYFDIALTRVVFHRGSKVSIYVFSLFHSIFSTEDEPHFATLGVKLRSLNRFSCCIIARFFLLTSRSATTSNLRRRGTFSGFFYSDCLTLR